jgi:hypothetical protein
VNMSISVQWLLIFFAANQVLSALVQALPVPNNSVGYTFFYKFVNLLVADFKTFSATIPQPVLTISSSKGSIVTTEVPAQK